MRVFSQHQDAETFLGGISNELSLHFLVESWVWGSRSQIWPPKHFISPQQKPGWIPVLDPHRPALQVLKLESSEGGKAAAGQSDLVYLKPKNTSLALWKSVALFGVAICSMICFLNLKILPQDLFLRFLLVFWDGGFSISWDNKKKHNIAVLKKFN